jgi:hypothetical protein
MWPAASTRYVTGKSKLLRQFGPEPQEPHAPPQQPPPPCWVPKSAAEDGSPPATAKLETNTLVLIDSQAGQIWLLSRSANLVRTSNFPEQLSHRYS